MKSEPDTTTSDCTPCDEVRIGKELDAEENARAFEREISKLDKEQDKVRLEKQLDSEENARALERDLRKLEKEHQHARDTAEEAAAVELQKSKWATEAELAKAFHAKIGELAGESIERSRDSAKYVQTAAAAIVTLYTGLLALVFSVTDNPLPIRGVYAGVFLGLAVALATAYLAFITKTDRLKIYRGGASMTEMQLNRTDFLVRWVSSTVRDRRWAIRASVLSLAVGVAFIPAPFISTAESVEIPEIPTAPAIPAEIAAAAEASATELFDAQVDSYTAGVEDRDEAIEEASLAAAETADKESDLNSIALLVAGAALLVVFLGPLIYGHWADKNEQT